MLERAPESAVARMFCLVFFKVYLVLANHPESTDESGEANDENNEEVLNVLHDHEDDVDQRGDVTDEPQVVETLQEHENDKEGLKDSHDDDVERDDEVNRHNEIQGKDREVNYAPEASEYSPL